MTDFKSRLLTTISSSPKYRGNRRQLSVDIGKGDRYISNLINNENPNAEPGLFTARKIADCLDVSIEFLAGTEDGPNACHGQMPITVENLFSERPLGEIKTREIGMTYQQQRQPKTDDIISWWSSTGGRLRNYESISDSIDLHHQPRSTDTTLQIGTLGKNSLASQTLGGNDPDLLCSLLDQLPPARRGQIVYDYARVKSAEFPITLEKILIRHPDTKRKIELTYQRLLLPVFDDVGRNMIMNFSKVIS